MITDVVTSENIPEHVVEYVKENLINIYELTQHKVSGCEFVFEKIQGKYNFAYTAAIKDNIIEIKKITHIDLFSVSVCKLGIVKNLPGYVLYNENIIVSFELSSRNFMKETTELINSVVFHHNFKVYVRHQPNELWNFINAGKKYNQYSIVNDVSYHLTHKVTICGMLIEIYTKINTKAITLKITKSGKALLITYKDSIRTQKVLNVTEVEMKEIKLFGVNIEKFYKQNPTAMYRMDKWISR